MSYLYEVKLTLIQLSGEKTQDRLKTLLWFERSRQLSVQKTKLKSSGTQKLITKPPLMCSAFSNVWSSPGLINILRPLPTLCPSYLTLYSQHRRQSNTINQVMSFCLEASVAHMYSNQSQNPGIKDYHKCSTFWMPTVCWPYFLSLSSSLPQLQHLCPTYFSRLTLTSGLLYLFLSISGEFSS